MEVVAKVTFGKVREEVDQRQHQSEREYRHQKEMKERIEACVASKALRLLLGHEGLLEREPGSVADFLTGRCLPRRWAGLRMISAEKSRGVRLHSVPLLHVPRAKKREWSPQPKTGFVAAAWPPACSPGANT